MDSLELQNTELSGFERLLAQQLSQISPDGSFVEDLRTRLVTSRIFEKRRMLGAIVVASLSVLLTGMLVFSLIQLIPRPKR